MPVFDLGHHALARELLDLRQLREHLAALGGIGHVVRNRRAQQRAQVLRGVGQGGIRADGDALHALRAVFGDVERRFAAGDIFRGRVAGGRGNHAHGRERRGRLVVAEVRAELGVEGGDAGNGRARPWPAGSGVWSGSRRRSAGRLSNGRTSSRIGSSAWPRRLEWSARCKLADLDLLHLLEALHHDFHVRLHDGLAQLAELLHILLVDNFAILLLRDAELLQQRADREERAQKGVALHAQLQIAAVGGFAGDVEAGQREDANLFLDDLLARPQRQVLPGALAVLIRLPHQAAALLHAVQRIGVGKGLGIAAENHGHVAQIAVDANAVLGGDHEVAGRRALLLRAVLGIGADVNHFLGIAQVVLEAVALEEQIVQVAEDRAQVFAGGDGAPSADGVEAHGNRALGQQRRRFVADDRVGMVDAEHEEVHAVGGASCRLCGRGRRWRTRTRR